MGTRRDANLLLPQGSALDDAAKAGELARFKVRGIWLYAETNLTLEQVLEEAERASASCLEEWLLGTNPILSNSAAKRTHSPEITSSAMKPLIQELCFRGALDGLGLVSRDYLPYIAFFRRADADEVARQITEVRQLISDQEVVHWRDLPSPSVSRPGKAWRSLLLGHAEYLGMGWMPDRWELIRW